jgi:TRAP-type C4-dicarboxylate transport system substrate-binding protein
VDQLVGGNADDLRRHPARGLDGAGKVDPVKADAAQRATTAKQNSDLVTTLANRGIKINTPDTAPFRAKLQSAGFYKEWSGKFAGNGWATLQKYVGALA